MVIQADKESRTTEMPSYKSSKLNSGVLWLEEASYLTANLAGLQIC